MSDHLGWDEANLRTWMPPLLDPAYREGVRLRIEQNIRVDANGCWVWQRSHTYDGYGQISVGRVMVGVHAASYAVRFGAWPIDLQLDHLCRVRNCANPSHLEPVTRQINSIRGVSAEVSRRRRAESTHCAKGHEWSEENTYTQASNGDRRCRRCHADREARRYAQRKASQ